MDYIQREDHPFFEVPMRRLAVLFFTLTLTGAMSADRWHIVTVDSGLYMGEYADLALDSSGYPHFSYYDGFNEDLKYACWDGAAWHIETVDSAGKVGRGTSLALDSNDYPHIAYYDWIPDYDLKYAWWDGAAWHIETVDSEGDAGKHPSLELDSDDYPHISYCTWSGYYPDDLKYAWWDGTDWHIETVDSETRVGSYTSLELDSSGYPRISYSDYSKYNDCDLKYAYWDGAAWQVETVDYLGYLGSHTSLALDSSGYPHIAYHRYNDDFGFLKYARWDGDHWRFLYIDSPSDNVGRGNSLVLDSSDRPHISYEQSNIHTGSLRYTWFDGADWKIETVYPDYVDNKTTLVLDDSDNPHISFQTATQYGEPRPSTSLKYAWFGGGPEIADIRAGVGDEGVLLDWAVEGDPIAAILRVLRSVGDDGPVAVSGSLPGAAVRWLDTDAYEASDKGLKPLVYWLEMVEDDGTVSRFGPSEAVTFPGPARELALSVYPSPAAGALTVAFTLPEAGRVTVALYDLSGRHVATVYDGETAAGRHEASGDVSALTPGVYLARLETDAGTLTRRLVVAR
jgi:hypothetical protein